MQWVQAYQKYEMASWAKFTAVEISTLWNCSVQLVTVITHTTFIDCASTACEITIKSDRPSASVISMGTISTSWAPHTFRSAFCKEEGFLTSWQHIAVYVRKSENYGVTWVFWPRSRCSHSSQLSNISSISDSPSYLLDLLSFGNHDVPDFTTVVSEAHASCLNGFAPISCRRQYQRRTRKILRNMRNESSYWMN